MISYTQTDTAAPLGVIQACAPVAPPGDADAVEATVGGTAGVTALAVAIPSLTSVTAFATELDIADGDTLGAGTLVHRFNVSVAQADLTLEEIYVCRVNSSGVSQETLGSVTGLATDVSVGGVFTQNVTLSAASAHNAGDRVYIVCVVANANEHTSRNLQVLPNQDIDTPFTAGGSALVEVVTETEGLSEATDSPRTMARVRDEAMWLLEAGGSVTSAITAIQPEALNLVEAVNRQLGQVKLIAETLGITEATNRARSLLRSIAEAVNVNETLARARTMARTIDEALGITETIERILPIGGLGLVRVIDEAVNVTESIVRSRALVRVRDEAVGLVEAVARSRVMVRLRDEAVHILEAGGTVESRITAVVDEIVGIAETIVDVLAAGAAPIVRVVDELVHIVEDGGVSTAVAFVRRINEAVNLVETRVSVLVRLALVRVIDEAVWLLEAGGSVESRITAVVAEALNVVEGIVDVLAAGAQNLVRVIDEAMSLVETSVAVLPGVLVRVVDEAINLVEATARSRTMVRVRDEVSGLVEGLARSRAMIRVRSEAVHLTETVVDVLVSAAGSIVRVIDEALTVTEAIVRSRVMVRIRDEAVRLFETRVAVLPGRIVRVADEALHIVETVARTMTLVRVRDEAVRVVESLVPSRAMVRVVDEALHIVEVLTTTAFIILSPILSRTGRAIRESMFGRALRDMMFGRSKRE